MGEFFHAVRVFFDQLAGVGWTALAIGLAIHFARLLTRTVAWRNILAASYPNERWRWRPVARAYIGGVGINSIVPGRAAPGANAGHSSDASVDPVSIRRS